MTRLKSLPSPSVIASLKGAVDIATWRNEPYARLWPRAIKGARSLAVQATAALMLPAMDLYARVGPAYRRVLNGRGLVRGWSGRDLFFSYLWTRPPFLSPSHFYCGHPYPPPVPDPFNHFWTITNFWWVDIHVPPFFDARELHLSVYPPLYTLVQRQIPGQTPFRRRIVSRRGQATECGVEKLPWVSNVAQGWERVGSAPSTHFKRFIGENDPFWSRIHRGIFIAATAPAGHIGWSESPVIAARWSDGRFLVATPDRPLNVMPGDLVPALP